MDIRPEGILRKLLIINLGVAILQLPVGIIISLFSISSTAYGGGLWLLIVGSFVYAFTSYCAFRKPSLWPTVLIGLLMMLIGNQLDKSSVKDKASAMCEEMRADPCCTESESSFSCNHNSIKTVINNFSCSPLDAEQREDMNRAKALIIEQSGGAIAMGCKAAKTEQ